MAKTPQIRRRLQAALDEEAAVVAAGMTATGSAAARASAPWYLAHKRATASGAGLRVVIPSQAVLRVMDITKVTMVLHIYPAAGQALADVMGNE